MESGMTALIGALAGINMISGAGMLDFLACQSPEKLVVDAEAIGMVKRLLSGVHVLSDTLATEFFTGINFKADFLKQKATRQLFPKEQYLPSPVLDRGSLRGWQEMGCSDTFERAKQRVGELITAYQPPPYSQEQALELRKMMESLARNAGMDRLPEITMT
jgi:trimethylamine--corrinoid protein Co-methyltransferase